MAAFDTPITPVFLAPANTTQATLFTATADTTVLVSGSNIGSGSVVLSIGFDVGGGVAWELRNAVIGPGDAALSLGPYPLKSGHTIEVQTDSPDEVSFKVFGLVTT